MDELLNMSGVDKFDWFFCFKTKEPKIQGSNLLGYKSCLSAKGFELASLKQKILFNASTHDLLNATRFMP